MARLNIEDSIWADPRFINFTTELGSGALAIGTLVMVWRLAQSYRSNGFKIPLRLWKSVGFDDRIIKHDLACIDGDFVVVRGAADNFQWLVEASNSGKRSAEVKKERKNVTREASLEIIDESVQRTSTDANGSQPLPLSLTLNTKTTTTKNKVSPDDIKKSWAVWNATLASFGIPKKNITANDQNLIYRAITYHGIERVLLALEGQRYEEANEKYNPAKNLSLSRVLERNAKGESKTEKLENLALLNKKISNRMSSANDLLKAAVEKNNNE